MNATQAVMQDQPLEGGGASPFKAYRLLSLAFNTALVGLAFSKSAAVRFATPPGLADLALTAVATHKIALIVTGERVTMTLRAPFTSQRDQDGKRDERPAGHGLQRALGELLTCPYCIAPWIATTLIAGHVFAPVPTRVVTTVFTIVAGSDWLTQARATLREEREGLSAKKQLFERKARRVEAAS
jgi:hypothetical protein